MRVGSGDDVQHGAGQHAVGAVLVVDGIVGQTIGGHGAVAVGGEGHHGVAGEVDRDGGVADYGDADSVVGQVSLVTLGILPAGDMVTGVGSGNQGHGAVGHDGVGAVVVKCQAGLAGKGVDGTHDAVATEGQHVGVVEEVALELHVLVDADSGDGLGGDEDAVEAEGVVQGHLGPVNEVVVGVGGGGEAQSGVRCNGVVVVGDVVADAVGQGGIAGDAEGSGRGDHGGGAVEDTVDGQVVARGLILGDHAVAALDAHDFAGLIPLVGQVDALGLDDTGAGDGVALVAGEVDRTGVLVVDGEGDDRVGGEDSLKGVVGGDGHLDGKGVEDADGVGCGSPANQVVTLVGDGADLDGGVGHDIPGAVVGSDGHTVGQCVAVVDDELVNLQVVCGRAADGQVGSVEVLDGSVLVVVGAGDGVTLIVGADGADQVGAVGDVEVDLGDAGAAVHADVDGAHAALEVHTVIIGLVGGDGDVAPGDGGRADAAEGDAVIVDHKLHVAALVVREDQVAVVEAEDSLGHGVGGHGEGQRRAVGEDAVGLGDEVVEV